MARKKDTSTGEPLLFEKVAPTAEDARTFDRIADEISKNKNYFIVTSGDYQPIARDGALREPAKNYFLEHVGRLRSNLIDKNVSADCIAVAVEDYAATLCGCFDFKATTEQMFQILGGITPVQAFTIDRFGVYCGLLLNYSRCMTIYGLYLSDNENEADKLNQTMAGDKFTGLDKAALLWLIRRGLVKSKNFPIGDLETTVPATRYELYFYIAFKAYGDNGEKLGKIPCPAFLVAAGMDRIKANLKNVIRETDARFNKNAENIRRLHVEGWNDDRGQEIFITHPTANLILSRPVEWSPAAGMTDGVPLQTYIDSFLERDNNGKLNREKYGAVTVFAVQKALEMLDRLPNLKKGLKNGNITEFWTTKNEFAVLSGLVEPNEEQQNILIGALALISDQYFIVHRPYKIDRDPITKKPKGRMHGGPTATRLVNVDFIVTGDIIIKVFDEYYTGKPTLIRRDQLMEFIKSGAEGLSRNRFNHQILSKGNKNIDDMVADVFGYNEKLKLAEDSPDPDVMKRAKRNIQIHKDRDRKKLLSWFDECEQKGLIKKKINKTAKNGPTISWVRLNVPDDIEAPQLEEKDTPETVK